MVNVSVAKCVLIKDSLQCLRINLIFNWVQEIICELKDSTKVLDIDFTQASEKVISDSINHIFSNYSSYYY